MTEFNRSTDIRSDDALEQLLKKASPRPMPSAQDEAVVRRAVRSEWQSMTGKRRVRQRVFQYALAATVVLGVFAAFNVFRSPVIEAVHVASIEKSFGAIYLLGESAELRETPELSNVLSGQTIITGNEAGLALAWGNGGSLRVDEKSRVTFTDQGSIYLESGRVYFDSTPSPLIAGIAAGVVAGFTVLTDHGEVMHTGTQFMAETDSDALVVSVREGQVAIDGMYHVRKASPGEQVTFSGRQRPTVLNISRTGQAWGWVARTSPAADVNGKSLQQFLDWACRELGLELKIEGQAAQDALDKLMVGTIDTEPSEALRMRLTTYGLEYDIEDGVLTVSD